MLTTHRCGPETRCFAESLQQDSSPERHRHSFGLSTLKREGIFQGKKYPLHIPNVAHIHIGLPQCVELFIGLVKDIDNGNISAIVDDSTAYRKSDSSTAT